MLMIWSGTLSKNQRNIQMEIEDNNKHDLYRSASWISRILAEQFNLKYSIKLKNFSFITRRDEISLWCSTELQGHCSFEVHTTGTIWYFESDEDKIAFLLRWVE